ncbi:ATP-grasp domain-containing protein [Bacteroides sp.]|uniref:ATP-grasp domain-containing protein n=1 Tax=Bacteroides sp. TaxID=29523 RepID=UPI00261D8B51|nr:ATP-grasp domain-containing protein [Bacteroides sp.]MDD3040413.1 ATP-grasp domain-containing protein [Bacteroides sp.]
MDKNSLVYWYARTQYLDVPQPETNIVWTGHLPLTNMLDGEPLPEYLRQSILFTARELGYPLFVRTDMASGKHEWEKACFVPSEEVLFQHIARVVEYNECVDMLGLGYQALILRKYIPLESTFNAFIGQLPIARERRYFARDGKVECHHPYWPENAILKAYGNKPENWKELLTELNHEDEEEIALLTVYAQKIAGQLKGYWSIDFAKGQDGKWYFIDAAEGERSWHPVCEHRPQSYMGE